MRPSPRPRARRAAASSLTGALAVLAVLGARQPTAHASAAGTTGDDDAVTAKAPRASSPDPDPPFPSQADCGPLCRPLAAELRAFGSINQLAFGFAAELQFSGPRFSIAGGIEINPWIRHTDLQVTPGSLAPYLSAHHRLPLRNTVLRQRMSVGAAILLHDTDPHAAGATGPYFDFAPLGVEFYGRRGRFAFVVDWVSIGLPIVAIGKHALVHAQYRIGFGLRL